MFREWHNQREEEIQAHNKERLARFHSIVHALAAANGLLTSDLSS